MTSHDIIDAIAVIVAVFVAWKGYFRNPPYIRASKLEELDKTNEALQSRCKALEGDRDDALAKWRSCEADGNVLRRENAWLRNELRKTRGHDEVG